MLLRRLYGGFWGWRAASLARRCKREAVQRALMHWGRAWLARAFNTWVERMEVRLWSWEWELCGGDDDSRSLRAVLD